MNSGIYVLRFSDGTYYIGKSDNIPNRWKQHWKDFEQGTHARRMQDAYNRCGEPTAEVFITCHPDHCDIYESLAIRHNWGPRCLNGNKPREVPDSERAVLLEAGEFVELSTAQHIELIWSERKVIEALQERNKETNRQIEDLRKTGIRTPDEIVEQISSLEMEVMDLTSISRQQDQELQRLKRLGLWDRIFNYKVYV